MTIDTVRRDYVLNRALSEGRIAQASIGHWAGEYSRDPAATEAVLATLAPMVGVMGQPAPSGEPAHAGHVHPVVVYGAPPTLEQVAEWSAQLFPETVAAAAGTRSRISADASYARP